MKKQKLLTIAGIITVIIIVTFIISNQIDDYNDSNNDTVWQKPGPFSIDRTEYLIGHKVFLNADGLKLNDKGKLIMRHVYDDGSYKIFKSDRFDGSMKSEFNKYFSPQLNMMTGLCSTDDLVGNWEIVFEGTDYQSIKFKIKNEILGNNQEKWKPIC